MFSQILDAPLNKQYKYGLRCPTKMFVYYFNGDALKFAYVLELI